MNKAKINLIGMCFLCSVACIFFGCNDDHSLEGPKVQGSASAVSTVDSSAAPAIFFATDLEAGSVQVLSATLDSVDAGVTIQMNVDYGDGVLARRLLMIKSAYDQSGNPRFDAKISDTLGDLLWQFSLGGDLAEPSHTWLTEKSGTDSITIEDRLTGESFSETYYQNGTQQRFGFPTSDVGHIAQRALIMAGRESQPAATGQSPEESIDNRIDRELHRFKTFYRPPASLLGNRDGFLVAQFLENADVANWLLQLRDPESPGADPALDTWWEVFCELAVEVVHLKCPLGGPDNPACVGASIAVITCGIVAVINMLAK